jgi:hypothetical protein
MNGWMDDGRDSHILMRTAITSRIERAYREKKKFQKNTKTSHEPLNSERS